MNWIWETPYQNQGRCHKNARKIIHSVIKWKTLTTRNCNDPCDKQRLFLNEINLTKQLYEEETISPLPCDNSNNTGEACNWIGAGLLFFKTWVNTLIVVYYPTIWNDHNIIWPTRSQQGIIIISMTIFRFIFTTFDSRMPLNVCDCFLFAVLKISKGLVFLTRKKKHSKYVCDWNIQV